jgi:hypothetical protein
MPPPDERSPAGHRTALENINKSSIDIAEVHRHPQPLSAPRAARMALRWGPMHRVTLRGFDSVELPNRLHIDDVAVHLPDGRAVASLPARPMIDDGQHVIRDDAGR